MISIDVPTVASNVTQNISLAGIVYQFKYKYNSTIDRLFLSIFLEEEEVISGIKLLPHQLLLSPYILPEFAHGDLQVIRIQGDSESNNRATLGTIGIDLPYEFVYLTNEEILTYGNVS